MQHCDKGIIFDIEHGSFVDGPGIRTTIFFKGCNLRCRWCHNPESWESKPQRLFYADKCIGCKACERVCENKDECVLCGRCESVCPKGAIVISGKYVSEDEVFKEILKDKEFYESGGGVTFSGGECMLQIRFLLKILKRCKEMGIHTAIDTAGNVSWEYFEQILPYTDLFLYDIKLASPTKHKEYTEVGNSLIIDNLMRLNDTGKDIIIRIPVIGGVNDSDEEMHAVAEILEKIKVLKIELLPYHRMGENKFAALGHAIVNFTEPSMETIKNIVWKGI